MWSFIIDTFFMRRIKESLGKNGGKPNQSVLLSGETMGAFGAADVGRNLSKSFGRRREKGFSVRFTCCYLRDVKLHVIFQKSLYCAVK